MLPRNLTSAGGAILLAACLSAFAQSPAGPTMTTMLPADGGDLGKAYIEFASAVDAGDAARIANLADSAVGDKEAAFFQAFGKLSPRKPIGGRRQGDRATLFLQTAMDKGGGSYELWNATHTSAGWHFDSPENVVNFSIPNAGLDCKTKAEFPCAVSTAPDSIVSGTVLPHKYDSYLYKKAPEFRMFDGFAVRVFDGNDKMPKVTTVFLSSMGIMPGMLTREVDEPNSVRYKLTMALLRLDVAADGKSAHVEFWNQNTRKQADVTSGLTIEAADGKRIRGRLKADVKELANFDLYFDIGTASVSR